MDLHKTLVASPTKIHFWLKPENNAKDNLHKNLHVFVQMPWDFLFGTESLTWAFSIFLF
jgi:hypothetical protein